jgi:hypothetical protein
MEPSSSRRPFADWLIPSDRSIAAWYDRVRRSLRKHVRVSSLLSLGVIAFAAVAAAVYGSRGLDLETVGNLLLVPLLVLAVVRPAWLVLALVALPPGSWSASITGLTILLLFTLIVHVARSGSLSLGLGAGLLPIVLLLAMSYLFQADVGETAAIARDNFLKYLTYYLAAGMLAFSLVRAGRLTVPQLAAALVVGVAGTAIGLLVTVGPIGLRERASLEAGLGGDAQAHFGYLSAMAFVVTLAWTLLETEASKPYRWVGWIATGFFAFTTALSLVRGAWLVALIGVFFVARRTGKLRYLWFVPFAVALILLLPVARDRLLGDVSGGVADSFASGQAGTGRWGLWQRLYDEASSDLLYGHGSGFAFTLDSQTLFGFEGEFAVRQETFVYPHNEPFFWLLDFGLVGVGLMAAFWVSLGSKYKKLIDHPDGAARRDALLLAGVFTTTLIAGLVANGIFIQSLAVRFFIASGALFALAKRYPAGESA